MSASSASGWQARFKEASSELNYGRRCTALSEVGKGLVQQGSSAQLVEELKGLAVDTFSALGVLTVAQKAGLPGVANALLGHSSQVVRLRAVRLLDAGDAEKAFLSEDSSKQTKMWLVRSCPALPCSQAVLEHAERIFPQNIVWLVLKRTTDEEVFSDWAEYLTDVFHHGNSPPGLSHLAASFPDSIMRLLEQGLLSRPSWDWVLPLAQQRPKRLLEVMLATKRQHDSNKTFVQTKLIQWCWRHQHDIMLKHCEEVSKDSSKGQWPALSLLELQQSLVSSHSCPTVMRKIDTIVSIFCGLPEVEKTVGRAGQYFELMPKDIEAHRSKELERLVSAYWQIVTDLGRGKLEQAANDGLFAALARRLPPPLAVEQFFRVCQDVDPADDVYRLIQSEICKTPNGRHDSLIQQVFEKYLASRREGRQVADCVELFQYLLQDVRTMDVIQASFEALTAQRLKGATERTLLKKVVSCMKSLDMQVTRMENPEPYVPKLPLPTSWLRFLPFSENAPPHVAFLHGALAAWDADPAALAQAVERFGTALFWSTLENVLEHALGEVGTPSLQWSKDKVDYAAFKEVAVVMPAPRSTYQQPAGSTAAAPAVSGATVTDGYFWKTEVKKQDTFNRDSQARINAYMRLINEGRQEPDPGRVLDDLVPFLSTRLGGEQEDVRFQVVGQLLAADFAIELWADRIGELKKLWTVFSKSRGRMSQAGWRRSWKDMGKDLVMHELSAWKSDQKEASEVCMFGVELAQNKLDWEDLFSKVYNGKMKAGEDQNQDALRWLLHTAVPLPASPTGVLIVGDAASYNPLQDFCVMVSSMAKTAITYESELWTRWSWLSEWWEALLGRGVSLTSADFLLAGVVEYWIQHQAAAAAARDTRRKEFWWKPLECEAYKKAVLSVLLQIETGEIPFVEGAQMLASRSQIVQKMEAMTSSGSFEDTTTSIRPEQGFGQPYQHWWQERPAVFSRSHPDKGLDAELGVLSKLVGMASCPRPVFWSVLLAVRGLRGNTSDDLLRKVIFSLDARQEGMARCIAYQFPYVNAALAPSDSPKGNSDLLTVALEMWLHHVDTRDARVTELMTREDAECLLFFGNYFAEHVSRCRQELLHQCLQKIKAPTQEVDIAEFYWHTDKIPSLARVAQFSKGWRRFWQPHCPQQTNTKTAILTCFWHPSTQAEFMEKGLVNTEMNTLAVIPALEYVDGVGRAGELLEQHPREQKGEVSDSTWTIIQPSGTFQSVWDEVEKRFAELSVPVAKNSIGDREADQLLVNLGRADHADNALKILGKYASKFKQAKEALVLAVRNLSPSHARRVIQDVCFSQDAGISLQVAALRLVADLQVPAPLELYRTAWRDGVCHRDIAANILVKVATSPAQWTPEEVRDMFEIFSGTAASSAARVEDGIPVPAGKKYPEGTYQRMSAARKENLPYIANTLTAALGRFWSLPFLPEVIVKIAFMPQCLSGALSALRANTNLVSEVVAAFTVLLREARLAARLPADPGKKGKKTGGDKSLSSLLVDLSACGPGKSSSVSAHVKTLNLSACDQQILRALVAELLMAHVAAPKKKKGEETDALKDALRIWVKTLRTEDGSPLQIWQDTLQEMEMEVLSVAGIEHLPLLAQTVLDHVASLALNRVRDGRWLFPVMTGFMERLMQHFPPKEEMSQQDIDLKQQIVLEHWTRIVGQGGRVAEVAGFSQHWPKDGELVAVCRQLVKHVNGGLWWSAETQEEKAANQAAAEEAARKVLERFAVARPIRLQLKTLAELWPQVLQSDQEGKALGVALKTFRDSRSMLHCVTLAEGVLSHAKKQLHLQLMTVRWLGNLCPRDAVRLWPAALRAENAEKGVQELLEFCCAKGLEPPEMPKEMLSNKAVLALLAKSVLPQARMCAVKGLRELSLRDKTEDQAVLLRTLREDTCVAVSVAAKLAWVSIFGEEEEDEETTS